MKSRTRYSRLHVELLEDRWMPSSFLVENLADSGPGSLRQAVVDANANPGIDVIDFAPAARDGAITLTSGELGITDDLTIDGPGADRLAVSGNDTSRAFQIGSGVTVAIDDLTITHGRAVNGGGIWNAGGSLSLSQVIVSQNQAVGNAGTLAQGGGVFNQGGALTVDHCTFSGNAAIGGVRVGVPVTQGRGGGIDSDQGATTTVSHSTFSDNQAIGGAAAPGVVGSQGAGGGLFNGPRSALFISHSTFTRNQAIGGAGSAGRAGGDANGGGLHHQNSDQATVSTAASQTTGRSAAWVAPAARAATPTAAGCSRPPAAVPPLPFLSATAPSTVTRPLAAWAARAATRVTPGAAPRSTPSDSP